jgi:ribosomal protein S18 acetylase RimI-like enzyme
MLASAVDALRAGGAGSLPVADLTLDDLERIAWSGNPRHLVAVRRELARVASGAVDYLAVRAPGGWPIAKGAIDYEKYEGAGTISQLATHPQLQGLGLGSRLMDAMEARITGRGLTVSAIGVEDAHHRARALYERQGYRAVGHETDSWEVEDAAGAISRHHAEVTVMHKQLG